MKKAETLWTRSVAKCFGAHTRVEKGIRVSDSDLNCLVGE